MPEFTREQLASYVDDSLSDADSAKVEQALRSSESLRRQLRGILAERDRGEHSIGAIWRRNRLTCASREQLGSYLLGVLDNEQHDYIEFHLKVIGCAFCLANLADLQQQHQEAPKQTEQRRERYFDSSAGLLKPGRNRA